LMHIQCMVGCNLHLLTFNHQNAVRNPHVAVFDRVDVGVVEIPPETAFITRESIPILVPDLPFFTSRAP
jgi:hypothetical protein